MPKQEIMLQAIVLLLVLGAIFAIAIAGAVFVVRAVIRRTNQNTVDSKGENKSHGRMVVPLIGLAIGLFISFVWKLQMGQWEWIDLARTILFGCIAAFFCEMIARLFRKR